MFRLRYYLMFAVCFSASMVLTSAELMHRKRDDSTTEGFPSLIKSLSECQIELRKNIKLLSDTNLEQTEEIHFLTNLTQSLKEQLQSQQAINDQQQAQLRSQQAVNDQQQAQLQSQMRAIEFLLVECGADAYTVIDDITRDVSYGDGSRCDNSITPGWYRFLLNGTNAIMPTSCVKMNHCNTDMPAWLDLQGQSLPSTPGEEITARACGHGTYGCCHLHAPITVRNCVGFYLYKLQHFRYCHFGFCVEASI